MTRQDDLQPKVINKSILSGELRQKTFDLFLIFVALSTAIIIWLSNIRSRTSTPQIVMLWLALEGVCLLCWRLRKQHLWLAITVFIAGMWLLSGIAYNVFNVPLFLYLFTLITLAATVLSNRFIALAVTLLSTSFITLTNPAAPLNDLLPPIVMLWFTLLASFIAFRSLYEALDMAWSYQDYAIRQMSEARAHRANLMQTTKVLNEVRHDLERVNTQLVHAHRAAEEARRLKAQFAANVSHELRTPINLIVGFSQTIVLSPDSYGTPLPPAYWTDMNTIYRSAKHLQSLINDVLDVSQIEAGKLAIVKEEIDSRQVIEEAANIARDLIESRGLSFKVSLPRPMPTMFLDRTRIRQVLLNLLSNAARFTDSGSIMLSAAVEDTELRIRVSDTGIGIPPSDLDRVFEEFHQVEGSLARRQGGSGLGLTLSKQFVEQHGGRIRAESEGVPGKGSTFTITLPLIDQSIMQRPGTGPLGAANSDARYFVVMDNDPAILQLFKRYSSKHKAVGVRTLEEALRLVETIQPIALVMDDTADVEYVQAKLRERQNLTPVIACAMPSGRRSMLVPANAVFLDEPLTGEGLHDAIARIAPAAHSVLIISYERETVRMFTRLIQAMPHSFQIWKAYSSEEGLALMLEQPPDLLLVDILVSDVDGITLLERAQSDPALAEIPMIIASTSGDINELIPANEGKIQISHAVGFQPMELIKCVEALIEVLPVTTAVR
jgi:signal transduction histidine kinase/CheY-like chemotaxis protein